MSDAPPFIVYALPRSRTKWLSAFLSYGGWSCGHEEIIHARTLDDVRSWFAQPCTGTAETAAAPWWRLVQQIRPDIRSLLVRRPVAEVVDSLGRVGLAFDRPRLAETMRRLDGKLDQIERRVPGVLSVAFADLANETACARVFEHCLPYRHDPAWWAHVAPRNIQISMPALMRYYQAHQPQLERLAKIAKHQVLASLLRPLPVMTGVTFQQEPFDAFLRDGQALFADHLVQVGEAPDAALSKNIPLMRALERLGALQVTTARSNGRMFGYLMTVIAPSLESPDLISATHTTFFVSSAVPGLGLKLQRAALVGLRARGVGEVAMRAGTRGSGPKMSVLYRRLGAQECGQMFSLDLRAI